MTEDANKKKIRLELSPAEFGEQLFWKEALNFYLYHIVFMVITTIASIIAFRFISILSVFLMSDLGFSFDNLPGLEPIYNFLGKNLVNIIMTIYCGIIYHYIYKVKGFKSFNYILLGIIAVLISFFGVTWLGGAIALIFPAILTTREKKEKVLNFEEDELGSFVEVACPECGSKLIEYKTSDFKEQIKMYFLGIGSYIIGKFVVNITSSFLNYVLGLALAGIGTLLIIVLVFICISDMCIISKFNARCDKCFTFFDIRKFNNNNL